MNEMIMKEVIKSDTLKNAAQLVYKAPPAHKIAVLGAATLGMFVFYAGKHYLPKIVFLS